MLIFENLQTTPRRRLFALGGVTWQATLYAWLSFVSFLVIGEALALVGRPVVPVLPRLGEGAVYALILYLAQVAHTVGHVVASRIVGVPAGEVLVTATFQLNTHRCEAGRCRRATHIGRALGGPAANLLLALAALAAGGTRGGGWLGFVLVANLAVAAFVLLPVPGLDGWVVWGELFGFRQRAASAENGREPCHPRLPLVLAWIGLVAMLVGLLDPLEGFVLELGGGLLVLIAAHRAASRWWRLLAWGFGLAAIGCAAMLVLSIRGGVGGSTGLPMTWGLTVAPYPIGVLMQLAGAVLLVRQLSRDGRAGGSPAD